MNEDSGNGGRVTFSANGTVGASFLFRWASDSGGFVFLLLLLLLLLFRDDQEQE